MGVMQWARAIRTFQATGGSRATQLAITKAHIANEHVLRLTVFPEDAPDDDFDSYRPGSPEEAVLVIDCLAEAMDATPGFLEAAVDVLRLAVERASLAPWRFN